ncbi:MAG: hypothetical protein AAF589_04175 [Planctomycetota bacterium]
MRDRPAGTLAESLGTVWSDGRPERQEQPQGDGENRNRRRRDQLGDRRNRRDR